MRLTNVKTNKFFHLLTSNFQNEGVLLLKNLWFESLSGYVQVEITGEAIEPFINRCMTERIALWSIKRVDDETISCYLFVKDIKNIRTHLKETNCKLTFKRKKGLPFFLKKIRTRVGIVIGLIFCLFVIFLGSNLVWSIQITGASPEVEHEVRLQLNKIGVAKGALLFLLPGEQDIQQAVTEAIDDVTWIGVKRRGTQYSFDVVEKTLPKTEQEINPRHLVAKKKAVIHKIYVEQGQSLVEENDFVQKGDLLVSGFIGTEDQQKVVPAKAEVLGEVWYVSDITIPLETVINTNTGNDWSVHYLKVGNVNVPVWGFWRQPDFKQVKTVVDEMPFYFLNWKLPISYYQKTEMEVEPLKRTYSEKEAIAVGKERAKHDLLRMLTADAEIKGEKILHQSVRNGKVNLKIHYQVIEEISKEQAIIQGD